MKALALALLLLPAAAAAEEAPAAAKPAEASPEVKPAEAPPPPKPPEAPPPPKPVEWKGSLGAGLIVLAGNSDSTTFSGTASASRETFGWILSTKLAAAYGRNRPAADGARQVTAFNGAAQVRLDRKFGEVWTVFVIGGLEGDHVANVEYRTISELGLSAQWIDVKEGDWQRLSLRTDLGLRYGYEARYQYYGDLVAPATSRVQPGVELLAPRLGAALRWGFSKDAFVTEEAEVFPSLTGASRLQAKSATKLSSRLTRSVTMGISYTAAYDSRPAEGKKHSDQALTALVEVGF